MTNAAVDPLKQEQKRLRKRISKLTRRLRQLKARHNSLSPINRLPPELLLHIFLSVQAIFVEDGPKNYYDWTVITHVSHGWRVLALSTKHLWNVLSLTTTSSDSPWIIESVERSDGLTMDVEIDFDLSGSNTGFLRILSTHHHNIRSLYIDLNGTNGDDEFKLHSLFKVLTGMAVRQLEEFRFMGYEGHRLSSSVTPVSLFEGFAPRLTTLTIQDVNIILKSIPFENLTSLKLLYEREDPGVMSSSTLLDTLRLVTRLQTLLLYHALEGGLGDDEPFPPSRTTPIPMSSLLCLDLYLPAHQCVWLLSHLEVPKSCYPTIWGMLNSPNPETTQSTLYTTPQSFFDFIFPYLADNPTDFISLHVHVHGNSVSFALRAPDDTQGNAISGDPSFDICSVLPDDPGAIVLPDLTRFSNVSSVSLTCHCCQDESPSDTTPPPPTLVEAVVAALDLTSLEELSCPIHFLSSVSNHLFSSPTSFGNLSRISIREIESQSLSVLDSFIEALARRKDMWGKVVEEVEISEKRGGRPWIEEMWFPYLEVELKKVMGGQCKLRIFGV